MSEQRPLVLYHANCNDGFCAAWVAQKRFGDAADYVPVSYGQEPPDVSGRPTYILDFSYKRAVMLSLAARTRELTILDHHKTAEEDLGGLTAECERAYGLVPPFIVFDMHKSGARLAWEYFFPGRPAPPLVAYVEDRDLWRFNLPFSKAVNAAIGSRPHDFAEWDEVDKALRYDVDACASIVSQGEAIERYKAQQVEAICRNAREVDFDGHRVLVANTSTLFSEVAGKLAEDRPFGAAWFIRADGKRQWSLRSRNDGVDVSEVASRRGGGGHRNAAGFETEAEL